MQESKSQELFNLSKTLLPGGVDSPVRAYSSVNRVPRFIKKAVGQYIWDVDDNKYIDYVCSWGPEILGHTHQEVIDAVKEACNNGLTFGAPTENEYVLAKLINSMMPAMEIMRFVNSGTEAVMSAIRVARGFTSRSKIIKFKGCYHGHSDGLLVKAGSAALTTSVPDSAGVPPEFTSCTLVANYNDEESVKQLFANNKGEIAAIIVEPVAANMGVVLPKDGFLQFLRDITTENGSLLIFDEVITGFRLALGGATEYYGITPDLITLGKIVGGGMPVGAYGGRSDIMQMVSPLGAVYQAGTLAGNPIAMTAGIKTLSILKSHPEYYKVLNSNMQKIATAMKEAWGDKVSINQVGSLLSVFFTNKPVVDYESATSSNLEQFTKCFNYLLDNGLYIAPSQYESWFLSVAHTDEDIARTCQIIKSYTF